MRTVWQIFLDRWDDIGIWNQYGLSIFGALLSLIVVLDILRV